MKKKEMKRIIEGEIKSTPESELTKESVLMVLLNMGAKVGPAMTAITKAFKEAGLTPVPCSVIPAPRVKEAKICLECRLQQVVQVGGETAGSGFWVIGEIVHFHINDGIWNDGYIDVAKLRPVGRMAGQTYVRLKDVFTISA
jgi:flavin reductase (DIM6/NTAB) family NADH-FMN oxidoreductase RutF